jgi:hypothetical protein
MSISPLNVLNQTPLVPQTLLGYTNDESSAIQINPNNITLGGNLTSTPVYVVISGESGLTTTRHEGLNVNCGLDINNNDIINIGSLIYNNGINIQNGLNNVNIISDEEGNLDLYINKTDTSGGLNIYNEYGSYMTFYGDGIAINDATNSIVGTNSTGLTLNSNNSITLNAPTINIPNLVITVPGDLTLDSLTYSNGINILDNIYHTSITSYNGTINNSTMDINVNNGYIYTQLNILSYNIVTSANLIFLNGIRIMDSSSQSNPNITGDGNTLQFNSQSIILNTPTTYISNIQSNGTLTLSSVTSPTPSTINLITTNEGTINLTASQVNMTTANASCNQVILTEQTSLPPVQAGAICYYNDSYYVCKVNGWILLV